MSIKHGCINIPVFYYGQLIMKSTVPDILNRSWKQKLQLGLLISSLGFFYIGSSFHAHFQNEHNDLSIKQSSEVLSGFSCPTCTGIVNAGVALSVVDHYYFCNLSGIQYHSYFYNSISSIVVFYSKSRAPPIV